MKNYKKDYLGNGQEVVTNNGTKLDIVKITMSVDEMLKFVHQYEGKDYVSFEVAKMKKANDYGDTHTVYHSSFVGDVPEEKTDFTPIKKTRPGRKSKIELDRLAKLAETAINRQDLLDVPEDATTAAEKTEMAQSQQTADVPF